jgi:hypothetical protein
MEPKPISVQDWTVAAEVQRQVAPTHRAEARPGDPKRGEDPSRIYLTFISWTR